MSHSLPPKSKRSSVAPNLPSELSEALARAREEKTDLDAWEALAEVCRELDRPDEAAALYTEVLDASGESALTGETLEDVGRAAVDFFEEWYEETGPVLEVLGRVLELDATQRWAFDQLTVLLTGAADWNALLRAYDVALSATEQSKEKQALYEEAAKIARDFAAEHDRASDYLKQLLLLRLDDEQLAQSTERRFDEQGRDKDLIEIWTARLAILSKADALKTRLQIAERYFEKLKDAASALQSLQEYVAAEGDEGAACALLERIADSSDADAEARRAALRSLDQLHSTAGRTREVISVAERALLLAENEESKIALHRRALMLYLELNEWEPAFEQCAALLKLQSSEDDVRKQARSIAEQMGRLDRFADALVQAAAVADTGERRVELVVEAAEVRRQDLQDAEGAIELFFAVDRDESADEAARLLACQSLASLLTDANREAELLNVLERWAALESKQSERRRILGRAAYLATELGDSERALGFWSLCLNDEPSDEEALSQKIALFTALNRFSGLVNALEARAEVGQDAQRQRDDLVHAADVHVSKLADVNKAISTWEKIEERFGRVPETIDSLVELSRQANQHERVVSLLNESIVEEKEPGRKVQQLALLGDTLRLHLQEREAALSAYSQASQIDPEDRVARAGLNALLLDDKLAHQAGEILADALRRAGDVGEIVRLIEIRLKAAPDAEFKAGLLLEVAKIEEEQAHLPEALQALRRAFALHPTASTEADLQRLAEQNNDWQTVVLAYSEAIDGLEDDSERGKLYLARGQIEEERLHEPSAATSSYREALSRDPKSQQIVEAMIRSAHHAERFTDASWALIEHSRAHDSVGSFQVELFANCAQEHGDWEGSLEGLADRIAAADELTPQVAHDLKKQLAVWYRDQLKDPDSAELVLKRAVVDFPQEDSLRTLAELQRRGPNRALVQTLSSLADVCPGDLAVLREAGEVALHPVEDHELATPLLERALKIAAERFAECKESESPEGFEASDVSAWATDHLVQLALAKNDAALGVQLLEASAELPFSVGEQVARRFRAAEVAKNGELDEKAVELCESVLESDGQHEGAIALLSEIHEKAGRLSELLALRKRELSLERPQERRLFLRLDQARVLGALEGELEERIEILQANLVDLPGHAQSIAALSQLLEQGESFDALAELYENQAEAILDTEPARAAELWKEAGVLADEQLGDSARLLVDFKKSAAAGASIFVLDRLALIAKESEAYEEEVSWLAMRLALTPEVAESTTGPEDRRSVVALYGRALIQSDELQAARQLLEAELSRDPAANETRQLLVQIYRDLSEWEALGQLQSSGVEFAENSADKVALLKDAASVYRRKLSDLETAIPLLRAAIELDGDDRSLKLGLADTLRHAGRYEEAAVILQALLEEFGRRRTKERAIVHKQLARIAQATGDLDEALEQAEAAAKIERTDAGILMLVGQLARQKGMLERAEQAYRTLALIASRASVSDGDEDELETVGESSVLFELYRIAAERGDEAQSRELLDSALEVASRDQAEALRLAGSLQAVGQLQLLLDALKARLDGGLKGDAAALILVTRANILEQSERYDEALVARFEAMSEKPSDFRQLEATQKLAERLDQLSDFWAHVVHLADAASDTNSVAGELWYRAGSAAEKESLDLVSAARFYEKAQSTGHKPRRVFLALDRVLDVTQEPERVHAALTSFINSESASASPTVQADALYRLAAMEFAAGHSEQATNQLMQALEIEAQPERALQMLEPLVRGGVASSRLLILFLSVARKAASEETLLFAFRKAAQAETVEASVLAEAVNLARQLDDQEALKELLSRSIELSADDESQVSDIMVERAAMARADGEFGLEVELLTRAIPHFSGDDAFELKLRVATCSAVELKQVERGIEVFEELFDDAPTESRVWRGLMGLYREAGNTDKIESLIELIADDVTDPADLEALKLERVRLMIGSGRQEEAEEELRSTLKAHPQMTEAAALLLGILREAERIEELRDMLIELLDQARSREDSALVARYGLELARLHGDEEREDAINVLISDIELTKSNEELLQYLLSLYTEDDNQSERSDVMEHLLQLLSGPAAKELCLQLVSLREALGDDFGVGRALEVGVSRIPDDVDLVERLMNHLREQGEHGALAEALMVRAQQLSGPEAVAKFAEAARLFDEYLGDPAKAAEASAAAFDAEPSDASHLQNFVRFRVNLGEVDSALEKLGVAIEGAEEFAIADLLHLRANVLIKERLSDRAAMMLAAQDLSRALEQFIPEDQEMELQQLRIQVLTELRSLNQVEQDEAGERAIVAELSALHFDMGDQAAGLDVLVSWLRDHESDVEMCRELGSRATAAGDPSAAVFAYQKLVEASEGEQKVQAVLMLADAAALAGDPDDARVALEDAFSENPQSQEILARLRAMYESSGAYAELAAILQGEVDRQEDKEAKFELLVQIGDLNLLAEDSDAAIVAYEEARALTSNVALITSKLALVYLAQGDVERARTVLDEAIAEHGKRRSPELALLQHGLAKVEEASGNLDGMFTWLEASLMSDRNNVEIAAELAVRAQDAERYDIAIKALQNLTLSKVDGGMSKGEAYYRQAQIALAQGDDKKALLLARRAQAADATLDGVNELLAQLGA